MRLNEKKLQSLLKNPIPGRHTDGDGLYLKITATGGLYWQWRITAPRETTVSYGTYPLVGLALARDRHREAKLKNKLGEHPNQVKRKAKLASVLASLNSFEAVAREWYKIRSAEWVPSYAEKMIRRLEADVFPWIGKMPLTEIEAPLLLNTLRKIESRGAIETAHRMRDACSQVFQYAIAAGLGKSDPAHGLRGALKKPISKHMAAITSPEEFKGLLRAIDVYSGTLIVRCALKLSPMLLVRPGELRKARWEEIDLDKATWSIPAAKMKRQRDGKINGEPHIVPLSNQAKEILADLAPLTRREDGRGLVFRGERDHERPMSENTINGALRRLGYDTQNEMTAHGFRATARTLLDENLGFDRNVIEAQLAHVVPDVLGRAYNRTTFLEQRRRMMQVWADFLDTIRAGENVVPVNFQKAA
jgi:integrase